jgi:hypothetical protein
VSKHRNQHVAFGRQSKTNRQPLLPKSPIKFEELKDPGQLPVDVKTDVARFVRSLEWRAKGQQYGFCFFGAISALVTLTMLGVPATLVRGGMIYRAGPDPRRDVIAWCGPDNHLLLSTEETFFGHYWLVSGPDLIDFTVGDWRSDAKRHLRSASPEERALGPVQWTTPALPDFFWGARKLNFSGGRPVPRIWVKRSMSTTHS